MAKSLTTEIYNCLPQDFETENIGGESGENYNFQINNCYPYQFKSSVVHSDTDSSEDNLNF